MKVGLLLALRTAHLAAECVAEVGLAQPVDNHPHQPLPAYTGYTFQGWSDGQTVNPYTFAVKENVELTAIFLTPGELTYTVSVSVNDPAMGSATVNGNSTASVMSGTEVTLAATPNAGYHFVRWNDNNTDNPRTVTVTADMSFTAYFESDGIQGIEDVNGEAEEVIVFVESGSIVVEAQTTTPAEASVFDITGRRIATATVAAGNDARVPVPETGVYLVKVGNLPTKKVVVIR